MFDDLNEIMKRVYGARTVTELSTVPKIVYIIATFVISIAFGASIIYLILSFINLATAPASGDPKKTSEALQGVIYACAGIALSIIAYAIKNILLGIFGITEPTS